MNSSSGMARINDCSILDNGADGIKYVHFDERPDDKLDRTEVFDLCTFPTTASQTFPVIISMEQSKYAPNIKRCPQVNEFINYHTNSRRRYEESIVISCVMLILAHLYKTRTRVDYALFANED